MELEGRLNSMLGRTMDIRQRLMESMGDSNDNKDRAKLLMRYINKAERIVR